MKRKTIEVEMVRDRVNDLLSNPNLMMEEKMGIITMIEYILHETNNYKGFMYLELNNGEAPKLGSDEWVNRKYF